MNSPHHAKTVINVVRADTDSLIGATTVARRIHEVAPSRAVTLEVFVFAGAQRALTDERRSEFNEAVDGLIAAGVPVSACLNFALSLNAAETLARRGIQLEAAREAYLRYTLEGATVISI
ncbi:hypothetical protein [Mycolicibacterium palauense]|uniref:hypothetical protein n=1 Tax=Mycolicibacterium palauense TaxID=2034511 RepID=UPI000BFEBF45|nr:hypothetical protein [Mycolicibacterium palauense]